MANILILNHYASPERGRHLALGRIMVKRGHRVLIMTASYWHRDRVQHKCRQGEVDGVLFRFVPVISYDGNGLGRLINMAQYSLRVGRHVPDSFIPDLVLGSSVHPGAWLAAERIAKRFGASLVVEVRDLWPQTLIDMGAVTRNGIVARGLRRIEKRAYHNSRRIISTLPYAHKYICAEYNIQEDKIIYITNGIDLGEFDRFAEEYAKDASRILAPFHGKFVIGYAGALGRANHLEPLIRGAAEVAKVDGEIVFVLFGAGPERVRLEGIVAALKLENVSFLGHQPYRLIPALMRRCAVHAVVMQNIPLYNYGISLNKLPAYLASGRPTVFSGRIANDIIRDAEAGISIPTNDPIAIAHALLKLKNNPEMARSMGSSGRRYAQLKYDYNVLADRFESAVFDALTGSVTGRVTG